MKNIRYLIVSIAMLMIGIERGDAAVTEIIAEEGFPSNINGQVVTRSESREGSLRDEDGKEMKGTYYELVPYALFFVPTEQGTFNGSYIVKGKTNRRKFQGSGHFNKDVYRWTIELQGGTGSSGSSSSGGSSVAWGKTEDPFRILYEQWTRSEHADYLREEQKRPYSIKGRMLGVLLRLGIKVPRDMNWKNKYQGWEDSYQKHFKLYIDSDKGAGTYKDVIYEDKQKDKQTKKGPGQGG